MNLTQNFEHSLVDQSLVKERKDESFTLTPFFTLDGRGPDKC